MQNFLKLILICISRFSTQDEFQILVNGIALGLSEPNKLKYKRKLAPVASKSELSKKMGAGLTDDELIFNLEEEQVTDLSHSPTFPVQAVSSNSSGMTSCQLITQTGSLKLKSRSPTRPIFRSVRLERHVIYLKNTKSNTIFMQYFAIHHRLTSDQCFTEWRYLSFSLFPFLSNSNLCVQCSSLLSIGYFIIISIFGLIYILFSLELT